MPDLQRVFGPLALFLLIFAPLKGNAMKSAPAQDVDVSSIHGRFRLTSKKDGLIFKAATEVKTESGSRLWKMAGFMGRWQWMLSPDGKVLVLFGSEPFGNSVALRPDSEVLKVFEDGVQLKVISLKELLGADPEAWADSRKLDVRGGGWVSWHDIFGELKPDWASRSLTLPVHARAEFLIQY
jgi:hypothetical protein